jgi:hypothetical protein
VLGEQQPRAYFQTKGARVPTDSILGYSSGGVVADNPRQSLPARRSGLLTRQRPVARREVSTPELEFIHTVLQYCILWMKSGICIAMPNNMLPAKKDRAIRPTPIPVLELIITPTAAAIQSASDNWTTVNAMLTNLY